MTALHDYLAQWDGKSADYLADGMERFVDCNDLADRLLDACDVPELQAAATWLLRHHLEQGSDLTENQTARLIAQMAQLVSWEARLHVLQTLPQLAIPDGLADPVQAFLVQGMTDKKTFVRAWSYGGALILARQHTRFIDWAEEACRRAQQTESASVKARLRQMGFD